MAKILVVGGAGFIGGAITDLLLNINHQTRVYDCLMYEESYRKPVEFINGDIREHLKLKTHLDWADTVIWLAALVGDGACNLYPELCDLLNNQEVKWFAENFNGRIIFPSTSMVYGVQAGNLTENAQINPLSIYAKAKCAAENHFTNKNAVIVRLGSLFGVGDNFSRIRLDLVGNVLTTDAAFSKKITLFGANKTRPLLHVRDVAEVMVNNIDTQCTGTFNLHWQNMKISEIANQVKTNFPETQIEVVPEKIQATGDYGLNSDKAREVLGFNPTHTLNSGINQLKELINSGRITDFNNSRYKNEAFLKQNPLTITNNITDNEKDKIKLLEGGLAVDDRGEVTFANDFDFSDVKRFYMVENHKAGFVRAWHAHHKEGKYVFVPNGEALIGAVKIDNWEKPNHNAEVYQHVLSSHKPQILYIPPGYANGAMSLTTDTKIIYFSTSSLDESKGDDVRYNAHYWNIWGIEER